MSVNDLNVFSLNNVPNPVPYSLFGHSLVVLVGQMVLPPDSVPSMDLLLQSLGHTRVAKVATLRNCSLAPPLNRALCHPCRKLSLLLAPACPKPCPLYRLSATLPILGLECYQRYP